MKPSKGLILVILRDCEMNPDCGEGLPEGLVPSDCRVEVSY